MTQLFYGTDFKLVFDVDGGQPDMDTTFAVEADPAKVLLADLYKIVTCTAGTLWWAPTATEDVTQARNDAMSPERRTAMLSRLQGAIEQDPRFTEVAVSAAASGLSLKITISAAAADRQLKLVLVTQDDGTLRVEEASVGNV